jgi:hypothetical protein
MRGKIKEDSRFAGQNGRFDQQIQPKYKASALADRGGPGIDRKTIEDIKKVVQALSSPDMTVIEEVAAGLAPGVKMPALGPFGTVDEMKRIVSFSTAAGCEYFIFDNATNPDMPIVVMERVIDTSFTRVLAFGNNQRNFASQTDAVQVLATRGGVFGTGAAAGVTTVKGQLDFMTMNTFDSYLESDVIGFDGSTGDWIFQDEDHFDPLDRQNYYVERAAIMDGVGYVMPSLALYDALPPVSLRANSRPTSGRRVAVYDDVVQHLYGSTSLHVATPVNVPPNWMSDIEAGFTVPMTHSTAQVSAQMLILGYRLDGTETYPSTLPPGMTRPPGMSVVTGVSEVAIASDAHSVLQHTFRADCSNFYDTHTSSTVQILPRGVALWITSTGLALPTNNEKSRVVQSFAGLETSDDDVVLVKVYEADAGLAVQVNSTIDICYRRTVDTDFCPLIAKDKWFDLPSQRRAQCAILAAAMSMSQPVAGPYQASFFKNLPGVLKKVGRYAVKQGVRRALGGLNVAAPGAGTVIGTLAGVTPMAPYEGF